MLQLEAALQSASESLSESAWVLPRQIARVFRQTAVFSVRWILISKRIVLRRLWTAALVPVEQVETAARRREVAVDYDRGRSDAYPHPLKLVFEYEMR